MTDLGQEASNLMYKAPVNLTIIEHSDHTTIAEAPAQMIAESSNSVDNIKEHMETIANSFETNDHLYVETNLFKELKFAIEETNWVTLLGKPGDGKSATAAHLMLKYRDKGFEPLFISSAQDWKVLISSNPSARQFIVMDDMFGTSYINSKKLEDWLSEIGNMERIVKARKGNLKVICTSRKYIFNDVQSALAKFPCFGKINIVDMTDDANELSGDEKLAIFSKFADEYTVELDAASLKKIPRLCPPHGFPHCVELFCTNAFFRQNGLSFFDNPSECVQKEIHNFKDNDRLKFLVLVLMVLKKSKIPSSYFGTLIENIQDDEMRLFKAIGVSLDTGNLGILKAVEALTNTYLKQDGDGSFVFTHESLKENVAVIYISVNPAHAAELLSFQQIVSYTKLGVSDTNSEKQNLSVARLPTDILVEKITKEVLNGNIKSVCNCRAWYDATFIDAWLSYIICENQKVPNCLLTKMLEGTFSAIENNAWEHTQETTLLATFIKNNMQEPVIAILSSKDLQHILKDSRVWNRLLQDGLELACSRSGKFNLDIIKTILIYREGDKMLDGSISVINALCASNVYCVKLLLDKTDINLDYNDGFGGYFHYLVMSDIPLEDYFILFDALLEKGVHVSPRNSSAYSPLDPYGYGYNTKKAYTPVFQCILNASTDENAIRKLGRLVYSGADVNGFYCGRNLVSFAIESLEPNTCLKVLTKLYELDANFHTVNNDDMNALHIVCRQSSDGDVMNVQRYLFAIGVDASHCDRHGAVPLMYALRNGFHAECIQGLFESSPSKHTDKLGQGYGHYLFQSGCNPDRFRSCCTVLLNAGEDINLKDNNGRTPVTHICKKALEHKRGTDETSILLQFLTSVEANFNVMDDCRKNLLHYLFSKRIEPKTYAGIGCSAGMLTIERWFITNEEDIAITSIYSYLKDTFDIDCFHKDKEGVSPFMLAIQNCAEFTCMKYLLEEQIPSHCDKNGDGYFHYLSRSRASDSRYNEIKSALLKNNIKFEGEQLPERLPHSIDHCQF